MGYITLSEVKKHLNIETEFTEFQDDDNYLNALIEVVQESVIDYCNAGLSGYTDSTIPKGVKHAMLLLTAHLYTNRTMISYQQPYEIPYAFKFLLDPYKIRLVV